MARILPFAAVHFNPQVVGPDLGPLISPPYDVVSDSAAAELAARHPNNAVRLELSVPPSGAGRSDAHREAARTWSSWLASGILTRDERPALYLCEHEFTHGGRRMCRSMLIGALGLDPPGEAAALGQPSTRVAARDVYAHEETMARPRQDRLDLLRACHAQFSPVLALCRDRNARILETVRAALGQEPRPRPSLEARGRNGDEALRVWTLSDPSAIDAVTELLDDEPLVIADGHHRLDSACRFAAETQDPAHRRALVALVRTTDPAVVVLPTCRVVRGAAPGLAADLGARLCASFACADVGAAPRCWRGLEPLVASSERATTMVAVTGVGGAAPRALRLSFPGETAGALRRLDTILEEAGFPGSGVQGDDAPHVEYTQDASAALDAVLDGRANAAFFPPAIPAERVFETALAGRVFPRKTTYFYPKAPAGLVMLDLDG